MSTTTGKTAIRRQQQQLRWHPPPPPTPRILHFPRRPRRKMSKPTAAAAAAKPIFHELRRHQRGKKLEALFDEERSFSKDVPIVLLNAGGECVRRERVVEEDCEEVQEKERGAVEGRERTVEVEILRAECKFLRMEREVALKKLERNRVQMERTLRSAVQTLVSGRKKICDGSSASAVLDKEIEDLAEKLEELQRSSGVRDFEVRSCSNFDKQASLLQRQLEQLGGISDEKCMKEIRDMAEASLSINTTGRVDESSVSNRTCSKFTDVEVLRRKMEGLSKGGMLLERMKEEYGSMLSTANSSVASSASNSKRIEVPDLCSTSIRQPHQETMLQEEAACSGRCKAIVRRIVEQVRAETEQWSQMQEMLGQVKEEMEELQASRDFWEDRALNSDYQIQSLSSTVKEWKQKALSSEAKANKLQAQISVLTVELERLKADENTEVTRTKCLPPIHPDAQSEKEKRVLICRLKENHHSSSSSSKQQDAFRDGRREEHTRRGGLMAPKCSPFRDIGNLSPAMRQISKAIFPLHCPEPSNLEETQESF
ncbi:hypothetical protein L1049_018752 [Liquidambar formosana]|uniref:Uncharacterized protein n=1 Tax=Liquidambar formosana TaxID=63359 RepID=A0AAP0WNW5_LIQFO